MLFHSAYFRRISHSDSGRYFLACAAAACALLAGWLVPTAVAEYGAYVFLCAAVTFVAMYCGLGPSVCAVLIGLAGAHYIATGAPDYFQAPTIAQITGMLIFAACCGAIMSIGEANRRATTELLTAHDDLDRRVRERTAELGQANASLRELTGHLLHLQDEERRRIARELHDSVGQGLAALSMNLAAVKADLARLEKTASNISDSAGMVSEISADIRTISHLLHPPLLDEAGLPAALRWYTEGFADRSNIEVRLRCPDDFGRLPQEIETAVFRIVQECLTNVHRHSASAFASIAIDKSDTELMVEVEDGGKGMSPEKMQEMASGGTAGVGVRGMRERIRQLGGSLDVHGGKHGRGTTVSMKLPLSGSREEAGAMPQVISPQTTQTDADAPPAKPDEISAANVPVMEPKKHRDESSIIPRMIS